eukprot:CAMPEP_0113545920 /NCGR_PEP_ID=MMETSP0015_2-20120614/11527_1 /TAXON_ID=2838 /ORGANISM="Odontella" /LENGTH=506 /DNA_ID=CAMNT_0000446335 /DNA_START=136 /DNA_END=1656 /DNA_ORIENTATION=- /assembly_acc=CAM_ASM_000160
MTMEEEKREEDGGAPPADDDDVVDVERNNNDVGTTGGDDDDDDDDDTENFIDDERPAAPDKDKYGDPDAPWIDRMKEVFQTYWYLGFVAFGGPQAHVAILRDHLIVQRQWMDEDAFMELFAIGQGLPGPTSTQLVVSTALARAGPLGGLMAFFLWNLPGLVVLTVCGVLISTFVDPDNPPWYLIGLPAAAISLVFKAFYGFTKKLDKLGVPLALMSCTVAILINGDTKISPLASQFVYPCLLVLGATIAVLDWRRGVRTGKSVGTYKSASKGWDAEDDRTMRRIGIPLWVGGFLIFLWAFLLGLSVILVDRVGVTNPYLEIFEVMFRVGSLIFGGGQVVLPLLQTEVVPVWMTKDTFLQGLGLAQSMPGPLFNFSSYLGAVYRGVGGALVAYCGLFGPGVMLIFAVVPFWARLRHVLWFRAVLNGLNATAIGLVGAACVLLWEAAVSTAADAMIFCVAGTLAAYYGVGAPYVVASGWVLGAILSPEAADLGQQTWCDKAGFVLPEQ